MRKLQLRKSAINTHVSSTIFMGFGRLEKDLTILNLTLLYSSNLPSTERNSVDRKFYWMPMLVNKLIIFL